jgi:5-methylcytosine-specific restriction protein A
MLVITFIIAIIALIISILAYQRSGGAREMKKAVDSLSSTMESLKDRTGGSLKEQIEKLTSVTESFRDRTADTIDRLEKALRRKPEEKAPEVRPPKRPEELKERMPTPKDFQSELDSIFASAQQQGKSFVEIKSGDLHRSVGGYHRHNHRLPSCCRVMKKNMKPGDQILQQPPSGVGATLIIRFKLPR